MRFKDKCGIFAIYAGNSSQTKNKECAIDIFTGLKKLQHRGQEGAGILTFSSNNDKFYKHRAFGLVKDIFSTKTLKKLIGENGVGHVRYATQGHLEKNSLQPFYKTHKKLYTIAIAHNGNITNFSELKKNLLQNGTKITSNSDTKLILNLILSDNSKNFTKKLQNSLKKLAGAYSLVIAVKNYKYNKMYAIRDPFGFRPLFYSKDKAGRFIISSETNVFSKISTNEIYEVPTGAIIEFNKNSIQKFTLQKSQKKYFCSFELIYFSHHKSQYFNKSVKKWRKELGKALWHEHPQNSDLITYIPKSAKFSAIAYAKKSKIPLIKTIKCTKDNFMRTFISPNEKIRKSHLKNKFEIKNKLIRNKIITIIDDSLVRGSTIKQIVYLLRKAQAKEIHIRISSPKILFPCFYGIDMPTKDELLLNKYDGEKLKDFLAVDSIKFLSLENLYQTLQFNNQFCSSCFNGKYPA